MPFGLTNAPSTFQSAMNDMFRPHLRKFILVFFDDILVYSANIEDHVQHLKIALDLLRTNNFFANSKKCVFGQQQLQFLGYVVCQKGVVVDPEKVQVVLGWPLPRDAK